ncbi:SDR family NAD(P)-dependent oxidoreductase [Streptomyces sp. NPDC096136]|uniref:SDR family NAD(P)-dependent oxidoreductase n=1 Tax=Streptomyces sp. NPDC096136 TaxID=3366076 RepID=UPI003826A5B1
MGSALTAELGEGHDHLVADLADLADLADPEGVRSAAAAVTVAATPNDLLVTNAGRTCEGRFAEMPLDETLPVLHLNCEALVGLVHAFLTVARPGAALVNVASTLAFTPQPGQAVYGATKAFVHAFSQALWYEQRPRGIHVLAVCPGPTATRPGLHADTPAVLVGARSRWPQSPSGSSAGGAATP